MKTLLLLGAAALTLVGCDSSGSKCDTGDTAWVDTGTDKKIVAAMKAGKSLKVKGTSWRGKTTEDSYSLQGISAALAAIDKACK